MLPKKSFYRNLNIFNNYNGNLNTNIIKKYNCFCKGRTKFNQMLSIYYKSGCKMPNKFPKERLLLPIVSYKSKQIDKKVLSNSTRSLT